MNILFSLTLLVTVILLSHRANSLPRVMNGTVAVPNSVPFIVSIQHEYNTQVRMHSCGGSILNERYILTAAHCKGGNLVVAGEHDIGKDTAVEQRRKVEKWIVHEKYTPGTTYGILNDVALVKLAEPLQFNNVVQKVKLPRANEIMKTSKGTVYGWGKVKGKGGIPTKTYVLNYAELQVHTDEECIKHFNKSHYTIKPEQMICAGGFGTSGGRGDSGGPFMIGDKQAGIVSWTDYSEHPCYVYPTVFTEVAHFVDWINRNMEQ